MKNQAVALIVLFISIFTLLPLSSQDLGSLAGKLGYPTDSKLLIIHADDLGVSHSTNAAVIKAFENNDDDPQFSFRKMGRHLQQSHFRNEARVK